MVKFKFWLSLLVLLFVLISFVNAKSFSLDPCMGDTIITEDVDKIYMESKCFYVEFDKTYAEETPITFYDSYNNDFFDLKLHSLTEINSDISNQQKLYSFEDIGLTASIENDKVVYTSTDGKIRLLYSVEYKNVKVGLEILNWQTYYDSSIFQLRTKVHKEDTENSHFINLPATVDGVEQPLIFESVFSGNNEFIVQTIYEGSDFTFLEIDPIYQVDYSPIPAEWLIGGINNLYAESFFDYNIDVTTNISDSNFNTYITTKQYTILINETLRADDGGFESNEYLSNNNEIMSVDYNITNLELITNMWVCGQAGEEDQASEDIRIYTSLTSRTSVTFPETVTPTSFTCFSFDKSWISEGVNRIGFGCYAGCSTPKDRFYLVIDTTSPDNGSSYYYNGATWVAESHDNAIYLIIEYGNVSTGQSLSGHWTNTYNPLFNWFLRIYKRNSDVDNISIYAYDDLDNLSNNFVSESISGVGYHNINVSSLLNYELNTQGLNFSQLRIMSIDEAEISELYLRAEINDTEIPVISNCQMNDTTLGKGDYGRISCDVTDNLDVDYVEFRINSTKYNSTMNINNWYYDVHCTSEFMGDNNWNLVEAFDILSNYNSTNPNINFHCNYTYPEIINLLNITHSNSSLITFDTIYPTNITLNYGDTLNLGNYLYDELFDYNHSFNLIGLDDDTDYYFNLTLCEPCGCCITRGYYYFKTTITCIWVSSYTPCSFNDTQFLTYTEIAGCGTLDNFPVDNGTYVSCDYCLQDLEKIYSTECYINGTNGAINFSWQDNNFFSCCAITSLYNDCSILFSPYNESGIESCIFVNEDFSLEIDSEIFFGFGLGGLHSDKVQGKIWLNDTNNTYKCISYVKTNLGQIIQTNPSYTKRVTGLTQIFGKEYEDREFFTTQNGLSNIYWTDDNLVIDGRNYVFGVECSGNGERLISEKISTVGYNSINAPVTRSFWLVENIFPIMVGFILFILLVLGLSYLWGVFKG